MHKYINHKSDLQAFVGALKTDPSRVTYVTSARRRAWRTLLVASINEGLRLGLFSTAPGDNRWSDTDRGNEFSFALPDGTPVLARVSDSGFDELRIIAAACPKPVRTRSSLATLAAGDAVAAGWLERRTGAWLQRSSCARSAFQCRRHLLEPLAALRLEPLGYLVAIHRT